jgi:hypothetical protein
MPAGEISQLEGQRLHPVAIASQALMAWFGGFKRLSMSCSIPRLLAAEVSKSESGTDRRKFSRDFKGIFSIGNV